MGALCQRMTEDLKLKNYSPNTQRAYLRCARQFAAFHMRSPVEMGESQIRDFLLSLALRKASPQTLAIPRRQPQVPVRNDTQASRGGRRSGLAQDPPAPARYPQRQRGRSVARRRRAAGGARGDHDHLRCRPAHPGGLLAADWRHRRQTHAHPRPRRQAVARQVRHALGRPRARSRRRTARSSCSTASSPAARSICAASTATRRSST